MNMKYVFIALVFLTLTNECYSSEHIRKRRRRSHMNFNLQIATTDQSNIKKIKDHFTERYNLRIHSHNSANYICETEGSFVNCIIKKYRLKITDIFNRKISVHDLRIKRPKRSKRRKIKNTDPIYHI